MIRLATLRDLPHVVAIYNESIPGRLATADLEPVSVASRRPWFDRHVASRPLWVDEAEGVIRGWCSLSDFHERAAYAATAELGIYVGAGHQRRGVGHGLVAHALAQAPRLGITTVVALVFGHNERSLRLLGQHGFDFWGRLPRVAVLDGVERDLAILGLRLGAPLT